MHSLRSTVIKLTYFLWKGNNGCLTVEGQITIVKLLFYITEIAILCFVPFHNKSYSTIKDQNLKPSRAYFALFMVLLLITVYRLTFLTLLCWFDLPVTIFTWIYIPAFTVPIIFFFKKCLVLYHSGYIVKNCLPTIFVVLSLKIIGSCSWSIITGISFWHVFGIM